MAKRAEKNYIKLPRDIFKGGKYEGLSKNAKWLYIMLNELEAEYTKDGETQFFRTDKELAKDCGMGEKTFKAAKTELRKTGLVKLGKTHFVDKNGKKSQESVTTYEITP